MAVITDRSWSRLRTTLSLWPSLAIAAARAGCIRIEIFEWLWIAQPGEWIAHDRFNQFESPQGCLAVRFHPIF
jgi:hypothetical protein